MFNLIRGFFGSKVKSVDDFVEILKKESCKTVLAEPYLAAKSVVELDLFGVVANFQYMLEFTSMTYRGRKIVYRKRLFERFGTDRGLVDAKERRIALIKLFLLGEQQARELQTKLPSVSVDLIGPNGIPMNDAMYAELHQEAADYNIFI